MENNRRGSEIFLGVIGVATLIVAIIGATFAFFSASTNSDADAISVNSTTISLNYADVTGTHLKTDLIPSTEAIATFAALEQPETQDNTNDQCIDDNGNEVCSVYRFTITNPSTTTTQDITVTLNVVTNEFTNLKYKIYEGITGSESGETDALTNASTAKIAATTFGADGSSTTLALGTGSGAAANTVTLGTTAANNSKTYTMVIWINEAGEQTTADAGKTFAAGLSVTSGSGAGVTGVIAAAGTSGSGNG